MKTLKFFLAAALAAPLMAQAQNVDFFPQDVFCVSMKSTQPSKIYSDLATLAAQIASKHSSMIARDLELAMSIQSTRGAIAEMRPVEVCASAVTLRKNIYLYHEHLMTFRIRNSRNQIKVMNLLFQTSSIQGLHGIGILPWAGLPRRDIENLFVRDFLNLEYKTFDAARLKDLFSLAFAPIDGIVEPETTSLVPVLDLGAGGQFYLATQMLSFPNQNPYLSRNVPRSMVLRLKDGVWTAAVYPNLFELYMALDDYKKASAPDDNHASSQIIALLKASE